MCLRASVALVKNPVDSMTMSTPRSPQGRFAGSRSANALIDGAVHDDVVVVVLDGRVEAARDGVVLQEVREGLVVGEVVHRDDLEVCALSEGGTEVVAADAAEAVDADLYRHRCLLFDVARARTYTGELIGRRCPRTGPGTPSVYDSSSSPEVFSPAVWNRRWTLSQLAMFQNAFT